MASAGAASVSSMSVAIRAECTLDVGLRLLHLWSQRQQASQTAAFASSLCSSSSAAEAAASLGGQPLCTCTPGSAADRDIHPLDVKWQMSTGMVLPSLSMLATPVWVLPAVHVSAAAALLQAVSECRSQWHCAHFGHGQASSLHLAVLPALQLRGMQSSCTQPGALSCHMMLQMDRPPF